jgi:hypothetical protein
MAACTALPWKEGTVILPCWCLIQHMGLVLTGYHKPVHDHRVEESCEHGILPLVLAAVGSQRGCALASGRSGTDGGQAIVWEGSCVDVKEVPR